jgi:hypothetical protein
MRTLRLALAIDRIVDESHRGSSWAKAKQPRPCKRNWFGSKLFLIVGSVLFLTTLKPFRCQAQAEIDPDHYEITSGEPVSQAGNGLAASRNAEGFRGEFTLPFNVRCAGFTLPPGSYSLSIRSSGNSNVVRLIPKGSTVEVQARVSSRSSAYGPSALVLARTGQERTLTAIRLKEPGITLYLEAQQKQSASAVTELVPIS